jgi:hypothetical protein
LRQRKKRGYFSDAKQDQFVDSISNQKKDGNFIDIGACDAKNSNNTFHFSQKGWKGICVEIEAGYAKSYETRPNTVFINQDALKVDWENLLDSVFGIEDIDYMSVDIDTLSLEFITHFPFDLKKPKVITIEHDSYLYGYKFRVAQREFLYSKGYILLFGDIYVEQPGFKGRKSSFEDWWICRDLDLEPSVLKSTRSGLYPSQVLRILQKCL